MGAILALTCRAFPVSTLSMAVLTLSKIPRWIATPMKGGGLTGRSWGLEGRV